MKLGGNNLSLQQGELGWIEAAEPKVIPVILVLNSTKGCAF
jgi:hypothetical protein